MPDKFSIRQQILEKRASLTPQLLEKAGMIAAEKLLQMEEYNRADRIMVYMDFRNEVPTGPILQEMRASGKQLILPYTDQNFQIIPYDIPGDSDLSDHLRISRLGISEPNRDLCKESALDSIEFVIVPGTVFDQYENRMGYGKGCYDRFLASLPKKVFKLALAYDFQVLPCIPADSTDVKMDKILTIGTAHLAE